MLLMKLHLGCNNVYCFIHAGWYSGTLDGTLILCISIQSECDAFAVIFTSYSAYVVIISM